MNQHQRNEQTLSRIQRHRDAQSPVDGWEEEQLREEAEMEEIKTCPFCGGEAVISKASNIYYDVYSVTCTGEFDSSCAGLEGTGFRDSKEEVITAWNKRVRI